MAFIALILLAAGRLSAQGIRTMDRLPASFKALVAAAPQPMPLPNQQAPAQPQPMQRHRPMQQQNRSGNNNLQFSLWKDKIYPITKFPFEPEAHLSEGDYVLVMVDENSTASITANTDLKRTVEYEAELKDFLQYTGLSTLLKSAGVSPGIDFNAESRTKGQGRRNRNDRIAFRLTCRIAWDFGDGTLFILGKKTMRIHDELTVLTISGNIKRSDIAYNKMVNSSMIHDLNLCYSGKGALTSNYTKSFWGKFLDWIWF